MTTTTTSTTTRRLSDTEYLARYEAEVRRYLELFQQNAATSWVGGNSLRALRWAEIRDDTPRLHSTLYRHRCRLTERTGSATLYALDAEGQRVEWQADE